MALRLILSSADEGSPASSVECSELIWAQALKGRCKEWVGGHGDKVLAAVLRCGSTSVAAAAAKEMAPLLRGKDIQKWAETLVTPHPKSEKKKGGPAAAPVTKAGGSVALAQQKPQPKARVAEGKGKSANPASGSGTANPKGKTSAKLAAATAGTKKTAGTAAAGAEPASKKSKRH